MIGRQITPPDADGTNSSAWDLSLVDRYGASAQSLEIVSPAAFLFSGPSLHGSDYTSSLGQVPSTWSFHAIDDNASVLEPLERSLYSNITLSVSEVLVDGLAPTPPPLPTSIFLRIILHLEPDSLKALRLTCHAWKAAIDTLLPLRIPPAHRLPNEVLQQVYGYLSPPNFDAARHTCRSWMLASLDRSLLVEMLRRGGWLSAAESDELHDIWSLSKRISRECALGGVRRRPTAMAQTAKVDFADLASGYAGPEGRHPGTLVFTASACGKYLLVAEGGMIYVYELWDNNLRPVTSVVCPRRVLAMSMDASARRFAVAALLDGRMGLVCDLHLGLEDTGDSAGESSTGHRRSGSASVFTNRLYPASDDRTSIQDSSNNRDDWPRGTVAQPTQTAETWNLHLRGRESSLGSNDERNVSFKPPVPVETGPRSIYRHLCSDDDPPRSVAICPQRRCVAFGCASGVELHWVDALSGQDFNRWFPLATPSDCLYFLPPRRGVDSAKKLRLISSTAHPGQRAASHRRQPGKACLSGKFWSFFGTEGRASGSDIRPRHSPSPPSGCDHYDAVPVSDGYHVLFTDPASNMLCLGSDAPLGSPTKLLRKVIFQPPETGAVTFLYAASAELRWGPRVVAAYGDRVVLYSVPPDVFGWSEREMRKSSVGASGNPDDYTHWREWMTEPAQPGWSPCSSCRRDSPRPIFIKGTVIGSLDRLIELAVHSSPDLTVWALSLDGRAAVWQVGKPWRTSSAVVERNINRDGLVCEDMDAEGDVEMVDVSGEGGERSVGVDGHDSVLLGRRPEGLHVQLGHPAGTTELLEEGVWYDADGDVVMTDAP